MCGIFGIYFFDKDHPGNKQMVIDATTTMVHRGPDGCGYFVHKNVGLGHRRLSIIDLSTGKQPMFNEDERIATVYNGEIYNYKEIKKELEAKGHIFKTDCDTEVIVHGYEQWGADCVDKFNGMFAFAVWDNSAKKMWVVRDRLGIKPLYYYSDKDVFICASEIKAILKTGLVKPELNENVLDAYFSLGYVPGPETMFKNIKKLAPGHWLMVDTSGIKEREYWDFNFDHIQEMNSNTATQYIKELLEDAVAKRLMSDVPLGAFLSGGLDSSLVVALMSNVTADPVNTFTVGYHEGESEEKYAKIIADKFKTSHNLFYLESNDFFSSLKTLVKFAEEPIVEPAAIALYHIAKLARKKVTVLLSGEGSDEIFGGYYLYQYMARIDKAHKILPNFIFPLLKSLGNRAPKMKQRKYLDWLTLPLSCRYQGTSSYLTDSQKKLLYTPDFFNSKSDYLESVFEGYFERVKKMDSLSQMLYVDTKTWLVDDLLVKADKMTMAASVELRVPFLDHRLVEAAMALPAECKIKGGEGKYILKKIAEPLLPREIVYRKKMGFPVPTKKWFEGKLMTRVEDIICQLKKDCLLKPDSLDNLVICHKKSIEDHSKILMTLLVFSEWRRQYG